MNTTASLAPPATVLDTTREPAPVTPQPAAPILRTDAGPDGDVLASLLNARPARTAAQQAAAAPALPSVVVGELLAIAEDGSPCITYPGQPGTAALRARSVVDLRAGDIGQPLVLSFERGDAQLPIVMGVLRGSVGATLPEGPQVQVDADGQHLTVSAREQLVLRCGKASITLTKAGKVLVEGTYVSSRSTGVNRLKGGSVQLN